MKWVYLVLLLTLASTISLGEVSQVGTIEVTCTNPEGCLGQIEKAIKTAPVGSIINIGPGSYYEKTILIDKDLIIQGAGIHVTRVIKIEPGVAFIINGPKQLVVKIQSLSISVSRSIAPVGTLGTGIRWLQSSPSQGLSQEILLKNIDISGAVGVYVRASHGSLTLQDSTISGSGDGIMVLPEGDVKISLEDNSFIGPLLPAVNTPPMDLPGPGIFIDISYDIPTARLTVLMRRNTIMHWNGGITLGSGQNLGFSKTEATLDENTFAFNRGPGIYLIGDPTVELIKNKIRNNDLGLELSLPPCVPIKPQDPGAFAGVIKGSDNEINQNAKGNVCPDNYSLPPGFIKP